MLTFSSFEKRSFRYENDDEKTKTKRSFLKTIVFQKVSFLKMVDFIKIVVLLTIVNDDPSLTIIEDERKPT